MGRRKSSKIKDKTQQCVSMADFKIGDVDMLPVFKTAFGDEVSIIKFTKSLFAGRDRQPHDTIVKFEVTIKKNETGTWENYHLVAKMIFPDNNFAVKEHFFYNKILPYYKQLEKTFNLKTNPSMSIAPTYYGGYFPVNPETSEENGNTVLLLENLETHGFYKFPGNGLDVEHARMTIQFLAKFHAIGSKVFEIGQDVTLFSEQIIYDISGLANSIQPLIHDPQLRKYAMRFKASLVSHYEDRSDEIWEQVQIMSICRGNVGRVDNILFHRNEDGKLDDVVMVDYKTYVVSCPFRDIISLISACLNDEVMHQHITEILELYFNEFTINLKKVRSNMVQYISTDYFERRLRIAAILEFPVLMRCFQKYPERIRRIVRLYMYKKWLG